MKPDDEITCTCGWVGRVAELALGRGLWDWLMECPHCHGPAWLVELHPGSREVQT